jgi:hypothetical protein
MVTPDMVYCEAHPDQPDFPVYYQEYRMRTGSQGNYIWVCDIMDIRDLDNPMFGMFLVNKDGSLGQDVSECIWDIQHIGVRLPLSETVRGALSSSGFVPC